MTPDPGNPNATVGGTCKMVGPNCTARPGSPGYTNARCYRCGEHCCAACAMVTHIPDVGERRLCPGCNAEIMEQAKERRAREKEEREASAEAESVPKAPPAPEKQERRRCEPPHLCIRLTERLNESNARRKGFTEVVFTHFETGRVRWVGVAYKQNASDRGLMLNFCPFCGVQLVTEGWQGIVVRENWNG